MNVPSEFPPLPEPPTLSPEDEDCLARVVAGSIEAQLSRPGEEAPGPGPSSPPSPALQQKVGVFVTVFRGEDLRGCLGTAEGREPLFQAVSRLARAAVSRDYRFEPVQAEELPRLRVELSLLGALTLLPGDEDVLLAGLDPNVCGVYLCVSGRTGLLLPQVARRLGWSARELLAQVCLKAGLPEDAWCDPDAQLFGFTARSMDLLGVGDLRRERESSEP